MGDAGHQGKRVRSGVSPEMKIPESVVVPEKRDVASKAPEKGDVASKGVGKEKSPVEDEKRRCKGTESCQDAPTVDIFVFRLCEQSPMRVYFQRYELIMTNWPVFGLLLLGCCSKINWMEIKD